MPIKTQITTALIGVRWHRHGVLILCLGQGCGAACLLRGEVMRDLLRDASAECWVAVVKGHHVKMRTKM